MFVVIADVRVLLFVINKPASSNINNTLINYVGSLLKIIQRVICANNIEQNGLINQIFMSYFYGILSMFR